MDVWTLIENIEKLFQEEDGSQKIEALLLANQELAEYSKPLWKLYYAIPICEAEREAGERTLFSKVSGIMDFLERNTKLKFYLRRIAFDVLDDENEFYQFCIQNQVSIQELMIVIYLSVPKREKVQLFVKEKIEKGELRV